MPLLRKGFIAVKGHVAYDIGDIGTFQDVPLSVHIYVLDPLIEYCRSDQMKEDKILGSAVGEENYQKVDEVNTEVSSALNDLFFWLRDGELEFLAQKSALMAQTEKDKIEKSIIKPPPVMKIDMHKQSREHRGCNFEDGVKDSAVGDESDTLGGIMDIALTDGDEPAFDEPPDTLSIDIDQILCACTEGEDISGDNSVCSVPGNACDSRNTLHDTWRVKCKTKEFPQASQPSIFRGVSMRPYQLQALYWMSAREGTKLVHKEEIEHSLTFANNNPSVGHKCNTTLGLGRMSDSRHMLDITKGEDQRETTVTLPREGMVVAPEVLGDTQIVVAAVPNINLSITHPSLPVFTIENVAITR